MGRISGPHGRLLIDLQTQTNTMIHLSPKSTYISGLQSRIISISGDQINVNYAAAVIENTVAIEQINRQQQFARMPGVDDGLGAAMYGSMGLAATAVKQPNGVAPDNGDYATGVDVNTAPSGTTAQPPQQALPKQPAF